MRLLVEPLLGLGIQRLTWTEQSTESTFQAVLVSGRLVSTASETKPLIA